MVDEENIKRVLDHNELLKMHVNSLAESIDKCSTDSIIEMKKTKGHLDFLYRTANLIDLNDYNTINDLLGEIGTVFKKCQCKE